MLSRRSGYYNASQTATHRGFSSYLGYYSGAEEHFTHEKAGCGTNQFDLANSTGLNGPVTHAADALVGNDGVYSVHLYGNESVRYIRAHDPGVPLFMYIAWNVVLALFISPEFQIYFAVALLRHLLEHHPRHALVREPLAARVLGRCALGALSRLWR